MLWLLLLQVLASCLWMGDSEVNTSFQNCLHFFFRATIPNNLRPNNPAWICQVYKNNYYFATLYNRGLRIPVYSAYIYNPLPCGRPNFWMVEPQLIDQNLPKSMMKQQDLRRQYNVTLDQIKNSQAVSQYYKNLTGLHCGHLNPCSHHPDSDSREATFTLTNTVPQNAQLNMGAWKKYEVTTMKKKSENCTTTYVVVGAVPGNNYIANGSVNIPSYLWASACCEIDNNNRKSWAVIAENDKNAVDDITLGVLETRLTNLYRMGNVSLFHSDCPRQ